MDQINQFVQHPVFSYIGALSLVIGILGILYRVGCFILDVTPVMLRFGLALRDRDIAIFATGEMFTSLKATILASRIFKEKNITQVQIDNPDFAKSKSIYLVDWNSFGDKIDEIFRIRSGDQVPVVIFAQPGSIDPKIMSDVANRANTVVVNARGRLLNDLVTSLVTTSYDRK